LRSPRSSDKRIRNDDYNTQLVSSTFESSRAPGDRHVIASESYAVPDEATPAVLDTSEVRWFALGRPPRDMVAAFSAGGASGTTEKRSDSYQLNGQHDFGLKRRFGWIVEAKRRQSVGSTMTLAPGLEAPLEEWRKWLPSDGDPVWPAPDARWINVNKAILTRTFMLDDGEVVGPASVPDEVLSGCDVEIAAVAVGGIEAWSFALEAFGPKDDRRSAISSSWGTLLDQSDLLENLGSYLDRPAGYPQWLDLVVSKGVGSERSPRISVS
jgi:hypothetical protein